MTDKLIGIIRCLNSSVWVFTVSKTPFAGAGLEQLYMMGTSQGLELNREKVERLVRQRVARAINLLVYYLTEEKFKG